MGFAHDAVVTAAQLNAHGLQKIALQLGKIFAVEVGLCSVELTDCNRSLPHHDALGLGNDVVCA